MNAPHTPDRHPDQTIEKVLTGLQATEAPLGLEQRILARVQARKAEQAARTGSPFGWLSAPHRARTLFAVASAALALGCLLPALTHHPAAPRFQAVHAPTALVLHASTTAPAPPQTRITHTPVAGRHTTHANRPFLRAQADPRTLTSVLAGVPAFPSPIASTPLTPEEQLLARIASSGSPAQRAALNPDVRAQLEASDEADFRQFLEASHENYHHPRP